MFDTLKYSKILEAVGVSRDQAEAHIKIVAEIVEGELATKQDIQKFETSTKQDIQRLENSTKQDIQRFETSTKQNLQRFEATTKQDLKELENKLIQLEYRLIIKLGALVGAIVTLAIAVTAALAKLF